MVLADRVVMGVVTGKSGAVVVVSSTGELRWSERAASAWAKGGNYQPQIIKNILNYYQPAVVVIRDLPYIPRQNPVSRQVMREGFSLWFRLARECGLSVLLAPEGWLEPGVEGDEEAQLALQRIPLQLKKLDLCPSPLKKPDHHLALAGGLALWGLQQTLADLAWLALLHDQDLISLQTTDDDDQGPDGPPGGLLWPG